MKIDVSLVIAALSLLLSAYIGISNLKKSSKKETVEDASSLITVMVKLDNISDNVTEIKSDVRQLSIDEKDQSLKIAKMEQQIKALEKTVFGSKTVITEGADNYHEN